MKSGRLRSYLCIALAAVLAGSCSTTRILTGDQQRLTRNIIKVTGDKSFNSSDLVPYLKQNAKGWTPFMCVYNWQNGEGKGWDRFVTKLGTEPVVFDSTMVSSSITNICDHLEYIGYYNSSVSTEKIDKGNRKVQVRYNVTLGKRFRISDLRYKVVCGREFAEDYYKDTVNSLVRLGDFLSEETLEQETVRSASVMRNRGYYDFSKNYFFFEADTLSVPDQCSIKLRIARHTRNETEESDRMQQKYHIGDISVSHPENLKFRRKVLEDLNNLRPGARFSDRSIDVAYARYSSVPLFNNVSVQLTPTEDNRVNCDINLQKGKVQGFKVGFEMSVNTTGLFGVSPELSYYHRNIFHGGEVLNVSVSTNHQLKFRNSNIRSNEVSTTASIIFPRFIPFSTKRFHGTEIPKTEVKFSYNWQNRPEYTRHRFSAAFGYIGSWRRKLSYQVNPISINVLKLSKIDSTFIDSISDNYYLLNTFMDHFDLGCNATLYYNSAGTATPKDSYWYGRVQFDLSGNLMSLFNKVLPGENGTRLAFGIPYLQYVRAEASVGKTFVFGAKQGQSVAMRAIIGAGTGYGNSIALPFEKTFYSGGASSLRGWTARTVGPGTSPLDDYWSIPNQSGEFKLEANIEYRFKIFWRFAGAVFVDAGNVWMLGKPPVPEVQGRYLCAEYFGDSIAADWGVGLRLDLSFLVLRVDYGMRFHDPARTDNRWISPAGWFQKGNYAFHFGVGYPF